jgi:hypothetical protein
MKIVSCRGQFCEYYLEGENLYEGHFRKKPFISRILFNLYTYFITVAQDGILVFYADFTAFLKLQS